MSVARPQQDLLAATDCHDWIEDEGGMTLAVPTFKNVRVDMREPPHEHDPEPAGRVVGRGPTRPAVGPRIRSVVSEHLGGSPATPRQWLL